MYQNSTGKKINCPFTLIFKKWIIDPSDISKHPAYDEHSINPDAIMG